MKADDWYWVAWAIWSAVWCFLIFGFHNKPAPEGFRKKLPEGE